MSTMSSVCTDKIEKDIYLSPMNVNYGKDRSKEEVEEKEEIKTDTQSKGIVVQTGNYDKPQISNHFHRIHRKDTFGLDELYDKLGDLVTKNSGKHGGVVSEKIQNFLEKVKKSYERIDFAPCHTFIGVLQDVSYDSMKEYHKGKISAEEMKDIVNGIAEAVRLCNDTAKTRRANREAAGEITDQSDKWNYYVYEDEKNLLSYVFEAFQSSNGLSAFNQSYETGKKIAERYGNKGDTDFMYYDANDCRRSEHMRELLGGFVMNIAKAWKTEPITTKDLENIMNSSSCTGGRTYNTYWTYDATLGTHRGKMLDISKEPPADFTFFFKERKYAYRDRAKYTDTEFQSGVLIVSGKNFRMQTDVPFNNSLCLGRIRQRFNLGELIKLGGNKEDILRINEFLGNFDVYTRAHSITLY